MTISVEADVRMTREALTAAVEDLLRAADRLGLAGVGIKLNEAMIALGRDGVAPSAGHRPAQGLDLVFGENTPPTWH